MTKLHFKRGTAHRVGGQYWGGEPYKMTRADSFWRRKLEPGHPLVPDSNYGTRFANQCRYTKTSTPTAGYYDYPFQMAFDTSSYGCPLWVMPAGYPTRKVQFIQSGVLEPDNWVSGLQAACNNVPVPLISDLPVGWEAKWLTLCAGGTDQSIGIWQPSTDTMWEFWKWAGDETLGYNARYGGVVTNFSQSDGTLLHTWGVRSCSLFLAGGQMMAQEFLDGAFNHAISVALPVTMNSHLPPATRHDSSALVPGGVRTDEIPAGTILRFPADIAINPAWAKLTRMMVEAIRDYGMVMVDTAGVVEFNGQDPRVVGTQFSNARVGADWPNARTDINAVPWEQLQHVAYP